VPAFARNVAGHDEIRSQIAEVVGVRLLLGAHEKSAVAVET
jgi:hypothetical protein